MRSAPRFTFVTSISLGLAIAFFPRVAAAQRGVMGRGAGRGGGRGIARQEGLSIPTLVNPVNLLIEHRQELALTDTQFVAVIRVKRSLDSTNAPFMRTLDSLQNMFKGGSIVFGEVSAARRDSIIEARGTIARTQDAVRSNISDAREKAYALLSFSQVAKAQDIEAAAQKAAAEKAAADEPKKKRGG